MRRAERLFRLVQELRRRPIARAQDLAAVLEVSDRTIYRDIAHLQGSGLPIEGEAGIGYMLRPGFDLPPMTFTHDQLDALALGLAFVISAGDPGLAHAAAEVRAKLEAALPDSPSRPLADAPFLSMNARSGPEGQALRHAIRARRIVCFDYRDGVGAQTHRRVRPLLFWSFPAGFMLSGWCEMRRDFRSFRLDRMTALDVTDTPFDITPDTSATAFLAREAKHCDL